MPEIFSLIKVSFMQTFLSSGSEEFNEDNIIGFPLLRNFSGHLSFMQSLLVSLILKVVLAGQCSPQCPYVRRFHF